MQQVARAAGVFDPQAPGSGNRSWVALRDEVEISGSQEGGGDRKSSGLRGIRVTIIRQGQESEVKAGLKVGSHRSYKDAYSVLPCPSGSRIQHHRMTAAGDY